MPRPLRSNVISLPATVVSGRRLRLAKLKQELSGARAIMSALEAQVRVMCDRRNAAQSELDKTIEVLDFARYEQLREAAQFAVGAVEAAIFARDSLVKDVARREKLVEAAQAKYDEVKMLDRSIHPDETDPVTDARAARR